MLVKRRYAEIPPRVELEFTDRGRRLLELVRTVTRFVDGWHADDESAGDLADPHGSNVRHQR